MEFFVAEHFTPPSQEEKDRIAIIRAKKEKQVISRPMAEAPVAYRGFTDPNGSLGFNPAP